ncbi:MAG: lysostaphin resistance A-like protein [Acutalibacteraceae bacterium]
MLKKLKTGKKILYGFVIVIGIFVIQTIASRLGTVIANLFDYNILDKDNIFMWVTVHHLVQMIIALFLMAVIHKITDVDFCLKPKIDKTGIKYTIIFGIVILAYVLISYIVGYKMNTIAPYTYELNLTNILGTLCFQLLLSGTSEEILFRALPISVLGYILGEHENNKHRLEIVVSAFLFSMAHISWNINPFTVSFSWFQLIYAFILGLAYGITYVKSKSIIYPIIMHGLSNFLMVGIGYIFAGIIE